MRKDSNYYGISQNISCHIFNIPSICHSSIQYIYQSLKTYILHIYIYILIQSIAYCTNIYQVPVYCPRCSCILIYICIFILKSYWLSKMFLLQGTKYLLLTWSSFVWCHVISSVPSQMLIIKTLSSLFDWCALPEWIQRFREMLCIVEMVFVGTDIFWD